MLMMPSDVYGLHEWRRANNEIAKLRHKDSMITEREFQKRKRRRQIAKASQMRNRYLQ